MVLHPTGHSTGGNTPGPWPAKPVAAFGERDFRNWLITRLSEYLQRPAEEIGPRIPFAEYGLDSVAALSLYGDIEEEFGLFLEPTVAWDHPTADDLARHLAEEFTKAGGEHREV
ncbi:acyl carrier protein [Streptomyces sp. NBC_01142]|uniref:acyl carrier protein n=1 Tax=Streptomyces sp. NBC_01142 TaxID=2975865 RepID=UPI0022596C7C|nr:acyl carrier protein [Streptomyces sp. NBC_01142]MCX4820511.1 acyl carrier protein [Streptomyces sp. NBC_01142]